MDEAEPRYFNRSGDPLTLLEWANLFEDPAYVRIGSNVLDGGQWISTVWLGGPVFLTGPRSLYETIVFSRREGGEVLQRQRYQTEEEAVNGHAWWLMNLTTLQSIELQLRQKKK